MLSTLRVVKNNEGWQMLSSENKGKKNVVIRHTAGLSIRATFILFLNITCYSVL